MGTDEPKKAPDEAQERKAELREKAQQKRREIRVRVEAELRPDPEKAPMRELVMRAPTADALWHINPEEVGARDLLVSGLALAGIPAGQRTVTAPGGALRESLARELYMADVFEITKAVNELLEPWYQMADREPLEVDASAPYHLDLEDAVTWGSEIVTALEFKRMRAGDIWDRPPSFAVGDFLIVGGRMCGRDETFMRLLGVVDVARVMDIVQGYQKPFLETGG